ncbi:MAG: Verru_Chthon cassette protein A [Candidatus Methylacidiphilales bacterium]
MLQYNQRTNRRRGVALVLVLAIMVLVMGLVVGILSRITTERTAADGYASSVQARLLGDTAVQVVQAQISAATTPVAGERLAWTSQPGLIRTFDDTGAPVNSYKLFSSSQMRVSDALVPADEAATLAGWYNNAALFTDLNMPVDADSNGTPDTWPILDSTSLGTTSAPQGFDISSTAPKGNYLGYTNPAPMPVRWLYVLKDGQLVAATGTGNVATVGGASVTNPIVGRIAFWTDDESCKVNINTASEGTYWDIPRADNNQERALGEFQPVKNEFQFFPGHPATTSISAVFPGLFPTPLDQAGRDRLFALIPRLRNMGSKGGTVRVDLVDKTTLTLDQDRLYVTEPELLFTATPTAGARTTNTGLDRNLLEQTKFFLTTTSRAPETNMFDLPKIACWPIHTNPTPGTYRTAFDQLIAFCGTLQGQTWYFQRQNANSATDDYLLIPRNQVLYSYLQKLMGQPIPGFGGTLADKFAADTNQVLTEVFDYIRCAVLEDKNITGTAGQFAAGAPSLPADNRTRLNYGHVMPIRIDDTRGFGRAMTITQAGLWLICTGDPAYTETNNPLTNLTLAAATPLTQDATTKEIRIDSSFIFEPFTAMAGWAGMRPDVVITVEGLEGWTIQGNGAPDVIPMQFPSLSRQTANDAGLYIHGREPSFTNKSLNWTGYLGIRWFLDYHVLRARNGGRLPRDSGFTTSSDGGTGYQKGRQYPFVGEPITVKVLKTNPRVTCSAVNLTLRMTNRQTGEKIQTIKMNFPGGTFPAPVLFTSGSGGAVAPIDPAWWTFQADGCGIPFTDGATTNIRAGRFNTGSTNYGIYCYRFMKMDHDTVRCLTPAKDGQSLDLRLLAGTEDVPAEWWQKHPDYDDLGTTTRHRLACSFVEPNAGLNSHPVYNYNKGKLANMTGNYSGNDAPPLPWPTTAAQTNGDWENGMASDMDGAFLNKPDEGNAYTLASNVTPYFNSNTNQRTFTGDFSSPNRIMPSPGMFGSLPTGVKRALSWQTLLFRRQPGHPSYVASAGGFTKNPDYLLMDFFWMPVVEPYAISEPLSTSGKINLNQQIIPFTYIERKTGLYAVLKNEKVMSIPQSSIGIYKVGAGAEEYRRKINLPGTLKQLDFRFDNTDATGLYAFRSPSEVCDFHFIPDNAVNINTTNKATLDTTMAAHWVLNSLTGDSSRERIYTTVYPRLTTKSNTYTVYFRAQALKQRTRTADADKWYEGQDLITGDYRGSTTLERFIDTTTVGMPDYAANPDATPTLPSYYRWRVRSNKPFAP